MTRPIKRESAPVVPHVAVKRRIAKYAAVPLLLALGSAAACETNRVSLDGSGGASSLPIFPSPNACQQLDAVLHFCGVHARGASDCPPDAAAFAQCLLESDIDICQLWTRPELDTSDEIKTVAACVPKNAASTTVTTSGTTSGETTSSSVTVGATTGASSGGHTTASATSSSSGVATQTCEQRTTKCFGNGVSPQSGCYECAIFGTPVDATNAGSCQAEFHGCFGDNAGHCAGGQPGCCTYDQCILACDTNHDGLIESTELSCVCSVDSTGQGCAATQSDKSTCLGALEADAPALHAMTLLQQCYVSACPNLCYGQ